MTIDQNLIKQCLKGDRRSQNELYKLTYPYLMSICIRYTHNRDRADETLNIGFFKILKYLGTYRDTQDFKPWMRKVMINTLIREYKKEKAHNLKIVYVEDYYDSEKYSELNHIIGKIDSQQLYSFIAQLHPTSRQVFNLYIVDGFRHKEIADMMDFSEGTSKWHLNQAREKLKEMITHAAGTIDTQSNSVTANE
jgi:RNA polymerase sigma factor (sigma-70 family)